MPILKNQRRELFCQGIVKGLNQTQAATNAGFSATSAESSASRLAKDARVKARIVELRALIVKAGETGLTTAQMATQAESIPFIRASVADRQYRLTMYQDFVNRALRLVAARAEAYKHVRPGGDAGLLVETIKSVRDGKRNKVVKEYSFDRALMAELREYLKQASVEMGDWTEKHDHTVKQSPPDPQLVKVPTEVLEAALAKMKEAEAMLCLEAAPGSVEEVVETKSE